MDTVKKAIVRRKGSAASKIKQLDWLMQFIIRMNPCAICGDSLAKGYNPRYPGKSITLHHTAGSREVDDWDNLEYVAGMVLCPSSCHRKYHLTKRHAESGKAVDKTALVEMERFIAEIANQQIKRVTK